MRTHPLHPQHIRGWHILAILWSVTTALTGGCGGITVTDGGSEPPDNTICTPGSSQACPYGGPPITLGVGICKAGTQYCNDAGTEWSSCFGEVLPQDEDCNSIADENCNGVVDENCGCNDGETIPCYSGPISTLNVGTCIAGQQTCTNGVFGPCLGDVTPQPDLCTTPDIDEDCDGSLSCVNETKRGLTWVKGVDDSCGQNRVICDSCDPYEGDTLCTEARPILCLRVDNASNCGEPSDFYDGWTNGTMALTPRLVFGTELTSVQMANTICANEVGPDFRMAEHHDGNGGWGWRAKGLINPPGTPASTHPRFGTPNQPNRFWVRINDTFGNCWD